MKKSLLVIGALALSMSARAAPSEVTVQTVASQIAAGRHGKTVVLLYKTDCSRSRALLPEFDAFVRTKAPARARVLVFSTDPQADDLAEFLSTKSFAFSTTHIMRWQPGQLTEALAKVGIRIGTSFTLPLLALVDTDAHEVHQWEGATAQTLAEMEALLSN